MTKNEINHKHYVRENDTKEEENQLKMLPIEIQIFIKIQERNKYTILLQYPN